MQAKRWPIAVATLLLSLCVSGCSKTLNDAAKALNSATQISANQPDNAVPGGSASNAAPSNKRA